MRYGYSRSIMRRDGWPLARLIFSFLPVASYHGAESFLSPRLRGLFATISTARSKRRHASWCKSRVDDLVFIRIASMQRLCTHNFAFYSLNSRYFVATPERDRAKSI